MKFNARKLTEQDYKMLVSWWKWWRWSPPAITLLPDNGTGGLIIEKNNEPIVAGFLYFTNSEMVLLEWIISNPEYRQKDRKDAIEFLIKVSETLCKKQNKKHEPNHSPQELYMYYLKIEKQKMQTNRIVYTRNS